MKHNIIHHTGVDAHFDEITEEAILGSPETWYHKHHLNTILTVEESIVIRTKTISSNYCGRVHFSLYRADLMTTIKRPRVMSFQVAGAVLVPAPI